MLSALPMLKNARLGGSRVTSHITPQHLLWNPQPPRLIPPRPQSGTAAEVSASPPPDPDSASNCNFSALDPDPKSPQSEGFLLACCSAKLGQFIVGFQGGAHETKGVLPGHKLRAR